MSWGWQKFTLFNKNVITDPRLSSIISSTDISCTSTTPTGHILFGDTSGSVHLIDMALNHVTIPVFRRRVNHILGLSIDRFICVGDDEPKSHDTIRLFQQQRASDGSVQYILAKEWKLSTLKIQDAIVTTVAKTADNSQAAFGLGNGMIVLLQGDIAKGKGTLRHLMGLDNGEPITGLGFAPFEDRGQCLYCVTPNAIFRYITRAKEVGQFYVLAQRKDPSLASLMASPEGKGELQRNASSSSLDAGKGDASMEIDNNAGAGVGCSAITENGNLVTATNTGFHYWHPEGRGRCFPFVGFDGKKVMIHSFKQYLVVISSNFVKQSMQQIITIYDFESNPKYIAFKYGSDTLQYGYIFDEWNTIFLIAKERKNVSGSSGAAEYGTTMIMLEEKDTKTKIESLTMKNQYKNAIRLVRDDPQLTAEIYKSYGDHLYEKKDYDNAMEQYLHTIHFLEPSYVIRKFLDAQRITNLTKYLEVLHEQHLASSAHTTLLLNCYTKLEDGVNKTSKLDKFTNKKSEFHYDVDTAIRVCRQAGYLRHALELATKHHQDDWFIKILIEDCKHEKGNTTFKRALKHIESLPFDKAEGFLQKYAKVLLTKIPKQTTNVLIRLCTNWFPIESSEMNRRLDGSIEKMKMRAMRKAEAHKRTHSEEKYHFELFGVKFGGKDTSGNQSPGAGVATAGAAPTAQQTTTAHHDANHFDADEFHTVKKSKADHFIQCFGGSTDSSFWMMVFLEHVIIRNPKQPPQSQVVYNTLIELYLENKDNVDRDTPTLVKYRIENDEQDELLLKKTDEDNYDIMPADEVFQSLTYRKKLLDLLQDPESNYDQQHVLVLVEEHNFKEGVLIMYEQRLHLHYDIIQHYMDEGAAEKIIESCIKYGDNDPNIWIQVLTYFSNAEQDFDEEIKIILNHIEKNNTLPPLLVVQILSKSRKTKIKTIKSYLSNRLQQEQRLIQNDMAEIKEFQKETEKMRTELHQLQTEAKIFQLTTCSLCSRPLELPAVHFMCGHSYHQACLPDSDECYQCSKQNSDFLKRKRSYEESANNHEAFFKQLSKRAKDGFDIVSELGFGRGVFGGIP